MYPQFIVSGMGFCETQRVQIPLKQGAVRSLCWQGDELVDWAGGTRRFRLDGTATNFQVIWAYRFDHALTSTDGKYQIIHETLGTKGLILQGNKIVREINRSFYCADVYEYPVAFIELPCGKTGIVHCPEEYNQIEIEEIESGKRLTARAKPSPDFFHSRLSISPTGQHLFSAGWVWHPADFCEMFSVPRILESPDHLDQPLETKFPKEIFEVKSAAFEQTGELLLVSHGEEGESATWLCRYDINSGESRFIGKLEAVPGTIMPIGRDHFVGFYKFPRLFEISTGKVVQSWPDLDTGEQTSSIMSGKLPPPMALDSERKRFAVAGSTEITVIQLGWSD